MHCQGVAWVTFYEFTMIHEGFVQAFSPGGRNVDFFKGCMCVLVHAQLKLMMM